MRSVLIIPRLATPMRRRHLSMLFVLGLVGLALGMPAAQTARGTLRGTVIEAGTGSPLGGVAVQAFCWEVVGSDPGQACGATQTANDGTYSLTLAPGTYKVSFDHWPAHRTVFYGGGAGVTDDNSLPVYVPSGGSITGIGAALVPLTAVTGTVSGNGQPVGGINVTAYQLSSTSSSWEPVQGTVTAADGTYALHVPAGTYRIGFSDAHGPYRTVFFNGADDFALADDVVVGSADVANINASMGLNYPITGKVTVDGVDMPGVAVTAYRQVAGGSGSTAWEAVKVTVSRSDGTYTLYVPDGTYRVGFATWQGGFDPLYYDRATSLATATDVVVAGAEVPNIDAAIVREVPESGPAITGTVTVADAGGPASGVFVTAWRRPDASSPWAWVRSTNVRPDGTYALYVPEGTYRVEFSHSFNRYRRVYFDGAATIDEADDVIVPSEGVPNVDAQLVENHSISGTITADPVPGFPPGPPPTIVAAWQWNEAFSNWGFVSETFSAPDGSYVLYVPDGTYRIGFASDFGPYYPVYYDGAADIAGANDVLVAGGNVSNINAHLVSFFEPEPEPGEPWPPSVALSGTGRDAWGPQVAVGPDGAAIATWYRRDGLNDRVQASIRASNGSWSAPVTLSETGEDASDPQVAAGERGAAVVVWRRWDGTHFRVQAITRRVNGSWSAPATLSEAGEDAWDPEVAMGPHGMAVVVWRRSDGTKGRVQASARMAYGPWSSPVTLSTAGEDAWDPQVAVGSRGTAVAVWSRSDGPSDRVQATTRAPNGSWSTPVTLSETGGDALHPQVAVDPNGAATVVWRLSDGGSDRIQAASLASGEDWSTPSTLSDESWDDDRPPDVYEPQVSVDPDGMVTVVWGSQNCCRSRVQASSRARGGMWSAPATLSEFDDAESARVAAGPGGKAIVVWRAAGILGGRVMAASRKPDGSWFPPTMLAEGVRTYGHQIAAGSDGTVAAVWELRDGGEDQIQSAVLVPTLDSSCVATTASRSECRK